MKVESILIDKITVGENTRGIIDKAELTELANSISVSGLLQPIGVKETKPGKYELIFGFTVIF